MATYTRTNAWKNGGTFSNPDLLWYAKGVGVMQSRALNDLNSWWFFAAMHGEYLTGENTFPGWGFIPTPPTVPTNPLPPQNIQDLYWNQCQHGSWYFSPWHRGYLLALEAQIRSAVTSLGGPAEWSLPYWNYFGPADEFEMPPAFAQNTLPDGTPNPLLVKARYGPNFNGNIFVTGDENADCQTDTVYLDFYGGPNTTFSHAGGVFGDLESNPHNGVHVDVGGVNAAQTVWGLMSDPGIAALDPIFYLHHSNIDRMWAAWNANGNNNPTETNWLAGPAAGGDREFVMPMPDGTSWVYTPDMVKSLSQVDYDYDDLTTGLPSQPSNRSAIRLRKLGAAPSAARMASGEIMNPADAELVGANTSALQIKTSGARATVRLDPGERGKVSRSLARAAESSEPDKVYLRLENVRGNMDSFKLNVSVNQKHAGTVALFGLRRASLKDGLHGGEGLTFVLDISDIIDNLFLNNALDVDSLDVRIEPNHAVPDTAEITVGRVGVYRQGQQ